MLNIKICLFVGRAVESLSHAISVVGMNSPEYQLQRGLNRSIVLKDLVGFLRPVDFSTRNVPAETASAAQALRLGQVSLALPDLFFRALALSDVAEEAGKYTVPVLGQFSERNFYGELLAILAQAGQFGTLPVDMPLAGSQVAFEPSLV